MIQKRGCFWYTWVTSPTLFFSWNKCKCLPGIAQSNSPFNQTGYVNMSPWPGGCWLSLYPLLYTTVNVFLIFSMLWRTFYPPTLKPTPTPCVFSFCFTRSFPLCFASSGFYSDCHYLCSDTGWWFTFASLSFMTLLTWFTIFLLPLSRQSKQAHPHYV